MVSCSDDDTVRIWDVATGKEEHTMEGHSRRVKSASFNRDGTKVVSCSEDNTVMIWDVATGKEEQIVEGHSECVDSASFKHKGTQVV